uniref:Uncharacterized protein n=1 Tax=Amphiprion percula TaxID=161767 RepID=A0A3P8TC11_AMPPE
MEYLHRSTEEHFQQPSLLICPRPRSAATAGKKKKKIPDRVTLKKEIGLLSACTIIIGEAGKQESCHWGSRSTPPRLLSCSTISDRLNF